MLLSSSHKSITQLHIRQPKNRFDRDSIRELMPVGMLSLLLEVNLYVCSFVGSWPSSARLASE